MKIYPHNEGRCWARDPKRALGPADVKHHARGLQTSHSKIPAIALSLLWTGPVFAHGGISSVGGFAEILYYILLTIVSLPLGIAIALRRRKKFTNWLMLALVLPTILFSLASFFLASVALYFAELKDFRMGIIFAVVGSAQLVVIWGLRASCRHNTKIEM